mgnify:FL=1
MKTKILLGVIIILLMIIAKSLNFKDNKHSVACVTLETECWQQTQNLIINNKYDMSLIADCFTTLKFSGCNIESYKLVFGTNK